MPNPIIPNPRDIDSARNAAGVRLGTWAEEPYCVFCKEEPATMLIPVRNELWYVCGSEDCRVSRSMPNA